MDTFTKFYTEGLRDVYDVADMDVQVSYMEGCMGDSVPNVDLSAVGDLGPSVAPTNADYDPNGCLYEWSRPMIVKKQLCSGDQLLVWYMGSLLHVTLSTIVQESFGDSGPRAGGTRFTLIDEAQCLALVAEEEFGFLIVKNLTTDKVARAANTIASAWRAYKLRKLLDLARSIIDQLPRLIQQAHDDMTKPHQLVPVAVA